MPGGSPGGEGNRNGKGCARSWSIEALVPLQGTGKPGSRQIGKYRFLEASRLDLLQSCLFVVFEEDRSALLLRMNSLYAEVRIFAWSLSCD